MPRPGPRPYECVRRAWHSERHQPMRGSLIKEIFRIAHEIHSPQTKKNKEWQEKLPIVVLKAEEIMYSKANSEAEYMHPNTLWERLNDAIDTIIRRDDSAETGKLLQPCIEAALNLGCIPRRASRSQRNTNPRFYLGPYSLDRGEGALKPPSPLASLHPNLSTPLALASLHPNFLNPTMLSSSSYSVYPLYYATYPPTESQRGFMAPADLGMMHNASQCDKESSATVTEEDQPEEPVCDLSLRLAPCSASAARNSPREDEVDAGSRKRSAPEAAESPQLPWQAKLLCSFSAGSALMPGS